MLHSLLFLLSYHSQSKLRSASHKVAQSKLYSASHKVRPCCMVGTHNNLLLAPPHYLISLYSSHSPTNMAFICPIFSCVYYLFTTFIPQVSPQRIPQEAYIILFYLHNKFVNYFRLRVGDWLKVTWQVSMADLN